MAGAASFTSSDRCTWAGSNGSCWTWSSGIDRDRFSPRVVCLDEKGAWAERFAGLGVPVDCVARPGDGMLRRIWRLAGHLRKVGADVVHAHNVKAHVQGGLAAALARVPVVVSTKHGRNAPDSFLARAASRLACRLSSHLVGVSKDCAAIWHEVERASRSKVLVITNGVDLTHAPAHVQSAPGGAHAVCVARLNVVKDPVTLLHAARLVLDREPAFRLDFAGDGPLRDYVERAVGTLDLGDAVRVLGTVDDIDSLMTGERLLRAVVDQRGHLDDVARGDGTRPADCRDRRRRHS